MLAGGCAAAVSRTPATPPLPATRRRPPRPSPAAGRRTPPGRRWRQPRRGTHEDPDDYTWDAASEFAVTLADGATSGGNGLEVDGDVVTITRAGTYRISGTLSDGQIVVETAEQDVVRLVLDGVDVSSSTGAALAVLDAGKVVVILEAGSQNALADAATYVFASADEDELNAAVHSAADFTISGDGSLAVTGRFNDGIAGKDGLVIAGGTITVDAADDGICGKDYLVVTGGTLTSPPPATP